MAALMSPPVAIRACRLASRLMKPMALSCSSCCWNLTSGVCTCGDGPCEVDAQEGVLSTLKVNQLGGEGRAVNRGPEAWAAGHPTAVQ